MMPTSPLPVPPYRIPFPPTFPSPTENDWNGKSSLENNQGYALSKLLAEKAAWAFVERVKPTTWDMVVLNPGLIFGPMLSKHHEEAFSIQFFKQVRFGW